ncbi:MAG: heme A synthase [Gammaproteobacteria bacterium]|nr:heme A synthase [Gammaproteobacteria bacterium]
MRKLHLTLALLLPLLAFTVIVKGAYVRLTDAGLGCPDWPGCYGQLLVPETAQEITDAESLAARPLETGKAWAEMIHRYMASGLGALILLLAWLAWRRRHTHQPWVALSLVPLVMFQGLLGMWTVTLLLKPLVVALHLLGGFTLLSLLWWNLLEVHGASRASPESRAVADLRPWALFAMLMVFAQAFLGGWTSTNYAALACTDFPRCHGQWWPDMDFANGFVLWRGLGVNYEFGVLDTPARTAIHFTHRLGAVVVCLTLLWLFLRTRSLPPAGRTIGWCILGLLALQIALGVTNVVRGLPLPVAVMHNGVAALLLLSVVTLFRYTRPSGP